MDENITYQLHAFIAELSAFSFSDPLVNLPQNHKTVYTIQNFKLDGQLISFSSQFNQLYKTAVQNKKTSDINSLCLAFLNLNWKVNERTCQSPILLIPVHIHWNKAKREFKLNYDLENLRFNPFIENTLKKHFDLEINFDLNKSLDEIQEDIQTFFKQNEIQCEITTFSGIGNFHHHRYELLKDLEEIFETQNPSGLVQEILGENPFHQIPKLELIANTCFPSDKDQNELFAAFQHENIVLQGPPGTGKTQVLANLIAKLLYKQKRHLVVSEKKTALEVLQKKLATKGLDHFVFLSHSNTKPIEFVSKLKQTWQILEQQEFRKTTSAQLSKDYLNQLQLTFDKLRLHPIWGEMEIETIQNLIENEPSIPFVTNPLSYEEWKDYEIHLNYIFDNLTDIEILSKVKPAVFKENIDLYDTCLKFQEKLKNIKKIEQVNTVEDLHKLNKYCILVQILANDSIERFKEILSSEKNYKKYHKLKKQYQTKKALLNQIQTELNVWNSKPTLTEILSWEKTLESGSWFSRRGLNKELKHKIKAKNLNLAIVFSQTKEVINLEKEVIELEHKLKEFGLEQIDSDINIIEYVLLEKKKHKVEDWENYLKLDLKKRAQLLEIANETQSLYHSINQLFKLENNEDIVSFLVKLEANFSNLSILKNQLKELQISIFSHFKYASTKSELEKLYIKSTWIKLLSQFPELKKFNGEKIETLLEQTEREEELEFANFAEEIKYQIQNKFRYYQILLQTPSAQLDNEQKNLKKELKKGKSILVKEFAKSKQCKNIRELLQGEARIWIDLLNPIYLSTPTNLSKHIPLESKFFECLIIDEASQLPLAKVITALQRAERVLIAGDSQQMSPSQLFSSLKCGVDVLHQASYYIKQKRLTHHYRSQHQALINFSNKHFYTNELIVYPSYSENHKALNWHYIEKGSYSERTNELEADAIAKQIEVLISTTNKQIGVVAFSESQLSCIWNKINVKYYDLLQEKITNNEIYFKALEQVQGEECEILLISFAYGKDENGKFHQRFGPLNQSSGSKRLNVLFTRAKEAIHLFSSVKASDFSLSNNEAVNLIRLYLADLEADNFQKQIELPYKLNAKRKLNELQIPKIHQQLNDVTELKTFHSVMKQRGWKLTYTI